MQPQLAQSGRPPSWQGVTTVREVGGHAAGRFREDAPFGRIRWRGHGRQQLRPHPELREARSEPAEFGERARPVAGLESLVGHFANLRCVETHPDSPDRGNLRPEPDERLDVALPPRHLARDGAVRGDAVMPFDVAQDAVVGGRRAPGIVFRLEAVDRHRDVEVADRRPLDRDRPHGARHDLRVDAHRRESRQQAGELAVADQRFAADDRDVQRALRPHERYHPIDQFVTLEVGQVADADPAAEVRGSGRYSSPDRRAGTPW